MDRLPTEIVSLILDDASDRHVRGGISSNRNAGIKAMRLCCRQFAELAADYLYSEVWLFTNEDSAAKAMAISQHLSYSSMVYSLKIFPKLLSDELLVKEEYETYIRGLQIYNEGKEHWGFDAKGNRDLPDEQIDAGFAEYTKLYEQRLEFSAKMQGVLNRLLPAFPRLEVLILGFATEMLEKYDMMSCPGRVQDMARRTLLATAYEGWKLCLHDAANATRILRVIGERSALAPPSTVLLFAVTTPSSTSPQKTKILLWRVSCI